MPERAINTKSATGCLLILLPAAMAMSALFVAWPLILGITLLIAGGNVWQSYEWAKTVRSIDPIFQQEIVQNRGEITPIDLSLKANVSGKVAQRYLVTKANEFGTGSRQHPERGQVYYFVSVSTLGSIFDDSERDLPEAIPTINSVGSLPVAPNPAIATADISVITPIEVPATGSVISTPVEQIPTPVVQPPISELSNLAELLDDRSTATPNTASVEPTAVNASPSVDATSPVEPRPLVTIIQSELAKRLDVHSSTVYKRRSEPNFTDWTRNRDPEGIGWGYAEDRKEYYRVDASG
jgi:hypothetical protein